MKTILKKNQVIIAALAIMLVVAGYLTFTGDKVKNKDGSLQTAQQGTDTLETVNDTLDEALATEGPVADSQKTDADVDPASLDISDADQIAAENGAAQVGDNNEVVTNGQSEANVGDAVLATSTISAEYFASVKLDREQNRAKNREVLKGIIDDQSIAAEQKQDAINKMIQITDMTEKENAAEALLGAKGFTDAVVNMSETGVDVIVNSNNLSEQQLAQVENVVKTKTGIAAKDISIHPVKVTPEGNVVDAETGAMVSEQSNTETK